MTLQITKDTTKGAPAEFWKISQVYYDGNVTQVEIQGFFNQAALGSGIALDTVRAFNVSMANDPLKDFANVAVALQYLDGNPTKTLFDANLYILEKYMIDNIPGWDTAVQI